jgi:HEAT repeats
MADVDREQLPASITRRELLAAIEGRAARVGPAEALKELARRRSPGRGEVFARAVVSEKRPAEVRTAAAVELGKEATPANQKALVRALRSEDRNVVRRAAESLGRIGDEQALAALEDVRSRAEPLRRTVSFARSLIAYRLGLPGHRLRPPERGELLRVERRRAVPLETWQETPELLKRLAPTLRRELPAVPFATDGALAFSCGGNRFLVVLNREVRRAGRLVELTRRSSLPAVVLKRSPGLGRYSVYEYLLAHPRREGGLHLFGVRTTGIVGHYGTVLLDGDRPSFELRALRTPHSPPLVVEGAYDPRQRRLDLEVALIYPELTRAQRSRGRPEQLSPPAR